ncbi:MAG: DUF2130 domain-containing protein [Acidobacteria bacterium]|nr:DUF2130 domain-containing protein [Acidobacteriota bacterium]
MRSSDKNAGGSIKCPKCGELIPITETLHNQLTEQARAEVKRELAGEQKALLSREKEVQARESKVQDAERDIEDRVAKRLAVQKTKLSKEALDKARDEVSLELKDLAANAADKDRKLKAAEANELQLRKDKRELETAKKNLELDVARRIDGECERIREEVASEAAEQHRLKDAEKDKKLSDALKMNEELSRKLQQGSQQTQGEVLELELEELLRNCCRSDEILPVPKGVHGADVLQKVNNRSGVYCGAIIWEAKHTKNWSDGWIPKLKDDQQQARADVAVIVTDVLPDDIKDFGKREGVWITAPKYLPGLVSALRTILEEVAQAKRAVASKNETVETLFNYLTGPDFTNRVEAIMRGFIGMKRELDEEKRIVNKWWAKREKQLDLVTMNTSGMYGDLQGLMGTSLKPIPALEVGEPDSEEEVGLALAAKGEDVPS